MAHFLWILLSCFLVSCMTTEKQQQPQQGIAVKTRDFSGSIEEEIIEKDQRLELLIQVNTSNKEFFTLVYDIVGIETSDQQKSEGKIITTKILPSKLTGVLEGIKSSLDRYADISTNANKIVITPRKIPNYKYIFIHFSEKKPAEKEYVAILSLFRRAKWRIISEWDSQTDIMVAIWAKSKPQKVAALIQKKLSQWAVSFEKHKITIRPKGTTILFKHDDSRLWNEIMSALVARFDDLDIKYRSYDKKMHVLTENWEGSITKLIKNILREDELSGFLTLKLDKVTKTITIIKK